MRKIFTFLFAALMSVSMFGATTVTWDTNDITGSGKSFTKDGVTITVAYDINFEQKNFEGGGTFTTTLGNFTKIEVTADDVYTVSGDGWSGDIAKKTWIGNASSVSFTDNIYGNGGDITFVFTIEASAPTTYTLQLVSSDPAMGFVEVTNMEEAGITDNGDGTYTVPDMAEVVIQATANPTYEFTGWREGNIGELNCYYCGTAINTEENPYRFVMMEDKAIMAVFAAAAPQMDETAIYAAFPADNHPAEIEIAFINRDFTWGMEALDNKPWYAAELDLMTSAEDTIKFRDKANNAMILCEFIPANGDQEGRWQQMYVKMANYEVVSFKGEMVRLIEELDLRDAAKYAWMENAPEPLPEGIEHIVLTEKAQKVIVNGQLLIIRDGKMFNLQGAQVK